MSFQFTSNKKGFDLIFQSLIEERMSYFFQEHCSDWVMLFVNDLFCGRVHGILT